MIRLITRCLLLMVIGTAVSAEPVVVTVDQISDPLAKSASAMFRFELAFVDLPDGGEILFRNSVGGIPCCIPDDYGAF